MMRVRLWLPIVLLAGVTGCASVRASRFAHSPPSLEEVLAVVNDNGRLVDSVFTRDVDISGRSGGHHFTLDAQLALEKPRRFRLRGQALGRDEVDLGSNDDLFWFWLRRGDPAVLNYCTHADFEAGAAQMAAPFQPDWIAEALGVKPIDPTEAHDLQEDEAGRLKLITRRVAPNGEPITKVTIIDPVRGWILEHQLFDARDRLMASAMVSDHQEDPAFGAVLPKKIILNWPDAKLTMKLSLGHVKINMIEADPARLWQKPHIDTGEVNLAGATGMAPRDTRTPRGKG